MCRIYYKDKICIFIYRERDRERGEGTSNNNVTPLGDGVVYFDDGSFSLCVVWMIEGKRAYGARIRGGGRE